MANENKKYAMTFFGDFSFIPCRFEYFLGVDFPLSTTHIWWKRTKFHISRLCVCMCQCISGWCFFRSQMWKSMTEFGMNQATIRKTVFFLPLLCFSIVFPIVAADSPTIFSCLFLRERQREKNVWTVHGKWKVHGKFTAPSWVCACATRVFVRLPRQSF